MAKTVGPYSPWRRIGQMIATSGQIGLGEDGKVVEGGFGPKLELALRNLGNVLANAGRLTSSDALMNAHPGHPVREAALAHLRAREGLVHQLLVEAGVEDAGLAA